MGFRFLTKHTLGVKAIDANNYSYDYGGSTGVKIGSLRKLEVGKQVNDLLNRVQIKRQYHRDLKEADSLEQQAKDLVTLNDLDWDPRSLETTYFDVVKKAMNIHDPAASMQSEYEDHYHYYMELMHLLEDKDPQLAQAIAPGELAELMEQSLIQDQFGVKPSFTDLFWEYARTRCTLPRQFDPFDL